MAQSRLRQYEAMFLMAQKHTADVEGSIRLCRALIEKHRGEVLVAKKWDERKLTYEIGKSKRGLYVITYFKAPRSEVAALERDVKLSEDFLRILVLSADHLSLEEMQSVEPQPIQAPPPERSWDAPGGFDGGGEGRSRGPRRRETVPSTSETDSSKD